MTTQILLRDLKKWVEEKFCTPVKLKLPAEENTDHTYNYKLVTPAAFVMFTPRENQLPPGAEDNAPSVTVEWLSDDEKPQEHKTTANIRLKLALWNPGLHTKDVINPKKEEITFTRDALGWQDMINWIDLIKRELRNNDIICNKYRVKLEDGLKSGFVSEQGTILDFWPYYFGYVEFTVEYGNAQAKSFLNLL